MYRVTVNYKRDSERVAKNHQGNQALESSSFRNANCPTKLRFSDCGSAVAPGSRSLPVIVSLTVPLRAPIEVEIQPRTRLREHGQLPPDHRPPPGQAGPSFDAVAQVLTLHRKPT
jgi:hypothetical protein